ncbi:MAG: TIGR00282 family metallophosphoesterase [Candidatus Latescibacterota bacterium]
MRILFVADIFARPGRRAAAELIPLLVQERQVDLVVANGENAAGGFGITESIVRKLHAYGVDVVTTGNHVWDRPEFAAVLQRTDRVLRPLNYPVEAPGRGSVVLPSRSGVPVAVISLQGRTLMQAIDCPFHAGRSEAERLRRLTPVILVDFHAEATAEKMALAWYLDGQVSAIIGTHTHVQTADERLLPGGTAYLTDAGMTGAHDSVIGVRAEIAIGRFLSQVPARFKPADGNVRLNGVLLEVCPRTGRGLAIERLQLPVQSAAGPHDEQEP